MSQARQTAEDRATSIGNSPVHICGEIRRGVTQSLSTHTLAILPTKSALYSPVLPRNSRPAESSPGESPIQPRTSRPGYSSPGENPYLSWNLWPFPAQPRHHELSLIRVTEVDGNTPTPPGGNCDLGKSPSISTGAVDSPACKSIIHVLPRPPKDLK